MIAYQVWLEGYAVTGNRAQARLLGTFTADSFEEAIHLAVEDQGQEMQPEYFDEENLTYWGCRFFGNEREARATFG